MSVKWLAVLNDDTGAWIKATSAELGISGSAIIELGMAKILKDKSFRQELIRAKMQLELNKVEAAIRKAEDQKKEILTRSKQLVTA